MTVSVTQPTIQWDRITDDQLHGLEASASPDWLAILSPRPQPPRQMRFPFPGGELVVSTVGEPPEWLPKAAGELVGLLSLVPNWDSYGAPPIDRAQVLSALRVLTHIMRDDSPPPTIVPTNRGGVQMEWHTRGFDLEIETISTQSYLVSFEDSSSGKEWEREGRSDFAPLVACIERLT